MSRYCQHVAPHLAISYDLDDSVRLKPDLVLPRTIDANANPYPDDAFRMSLTATWNDDARAYDITRLSIEKNTEPITTLGLRSIAVQEFFRRAVELGAELEDGSAFKVSYPSQRAAINAGDQDQRLLWVARVYAVSRAFAAPPLKTVAEWLGVSQSTATRLAATARERGLLDGVG